MKPRSPITFILGVALVVVGVLLTVRGGYPIPVIVGGALCYLGWCGGRTAMIVFGHACVALGCYLITWGVYLLPYSEPIPAHILGRPLFWGLISLFGGICAIYHGFCNCVGRKKPGAPCVKSSSNR